MAKLNSGTRIYGNLTVDTWANLTSSTTSTSSTTGALVIAGGAGIGGNVTVGGNVTYQTGVIDSAFFVANVVTGQNLFANVLYHKFVANATPFTTISNLWITLPSGAENGREIQISSLTPITSCYVNQAGTPVLWVANNWSASGNVSVILTYNSSNSKWMLF